MEESKTEVIARLKLWAKTAETHAPLAPMLHDLHAAIDLLSQEADCPECGHNPLRRCRTCDSKCATCEHEGLRQRVAFTQDYEALVTQRDEAKAEGIAIGRLSGDLLAAELRAKLSSQEAAAPNPWQPIATANKKAKNLIGWWHHPIYGWLWGRARYSPPSAVFRDGYWYTDNGGEPTHWTTVPVPPASLTSAQTPPMGETETADWHPSHRLGVLGCNACGCGGKHPAAMQPCRPHPHVHTSAQTPQEKA